MARADAQWRVSGARRRLPVAAAFGFRAGTKRVAVRSVTDTRAAQLSIVWEKALELPLFTVPTQATVFARERWESAPLMAGFREGAAACSGSRPAGRQGYERFP